MIDPNLLARYCRVVDFNLEPRQWWLNLDYENREWDQWREPGTHSDIIRHLEGRYWVVTTAPYDPESRRRRLIRWVKIDLDSEEGRREDLLDRYSLVRRVMGPDLVPVVWRTPSGHGLRAAWAVPETPLRWFTTGRQSGLLAEVFRAAGLEPEQGRLEIFPQKATGDRLPLGSRMPLLDPDTLQPLFETGGDGPLGLADLDRSLSILEEAAAHPHWKLHRHLKAQKPRKPNPRARGSRKKTPTAGGPRSDAAGSVQQVARDGAAVSASRFVRQPDGRVSLGPQLEDLVTNGLPSRKTRYDSEYLVAMAMHLAPERFADYGLFRAADDVVLANAVARWVAQHHNGHSREWREALAHGGSEAGAMARFAARYLSRNQDSGEHMIDRARRAALSIDPLGREVRQLAPSDRELVLRLSEGRYRPGAQRYRCEVWLSAFLRAVKDAARFNLDRGQLVEAALADGSEAVEVELRADWLEGAPYGGGRSRSTGRTRYVDYLKILIDDGLVEVAKEYSAASDGRPGRARTFRVATPATATLHDLVFGGKVYPPWDVMKVLDRVIVDGNRGPAWLDDAYHDLFLTTSSNSLVSRYGRYTADKIRGRAALLEDGVEVTRPGQAASLRVAA